MRWYLARIDLLGRWHERLRRAGFGRNNVCVRLGGRTHRLAWPAGLGLELYFTEHGDVTVRRDTDGRTLTTTLLIWPSWRGRPILLSPVGCTLRKDWGSSLKCLRGRATYNESEGPVQSHVFLYGSAGFDKSCPHSDRAGWVVCYYLGGNYYGVDLGSVRNGAA